MPWSPWLSGRSGLPCIREVVQLSSRRGLWDLRQVPCLGPLWCPCCSEVHESKEIALCGQQFFSSLWMVQCIKTPRQGDCALWQTYAGRTTSGGMLALALQVWCWFYSRSKAEPSEEMPDEKFAAIPCSRALGLGLSLAGSLQLETETQTKTQPVLRGLHPSTILLWRAVVWMTRTINKHKYWLSLVHTEVGWETSAQQSRRQMPELELLPLVSLFWKERSKAIQGKPSSRHGAWAWSHILPTPFNWE